MDGIWAKYNRLTIMWFDWNSVTFLSLRISGGRRPMSLFATAECCEVAEGLRSASLHSVLPTVRLVIAAQ